MAQGLAIAHWDAGMLLADDGLFVDFADLAGLVLGEVIVLPSDLAGSDPSACDMPEVGLRAPILLDGVVWPFIEPLASCEDGAPPVGFSPDADGEVVPAGTFCAQAALSAAAEIKATPSR